MSATLDDLKVLAVLADLKAKIIDEEKQYPIEHEYRGDKIIQHGENDFCGYYYNYDREICEVTSKTLAGVKEKLEQAKAEAYRVGIFERLRDDFQMNAKAANFVIDLMSSFHSTQGAALMRIEDYLNDHNYC